LKKTPDTADGKKPVFPGGAAHYSTDRDLPDDLAPSGEGAINSSLIFFLNIS